MKEKKITIRTDTMSKYLQIFNGLFELTDTEMQILAAFIDVHDRYSRKGVTINMFDTLIRKEVAKELGRDDYTTLNNFIRSMRSKDAIQPVGDSGKYKINDILRPLGEKRVVFNLKND